MPNETGDMKILGNFRKEIDFCAAESAYNSSNALLAIAAMNNRYDGALAAVEAISAVNPAYKIAVNARAEAYEAAIKIYRRSRNILKSIGASPEFIADAQTYARKIFGTRKSDKAVDDPETPENEAAKSHSASQLSYEAILGNMISYNDLLAAEPLYAPNETDLQIAALNAIVADLQAKNDAVSQTFVPLSNARALRDQLLYINKDCVINVALACKDYVEGAFGSDSTLFKQIKGLKFERKKFRR